MNFFQTILKPLIFRGLRLSFFVLFPEQSCSFFLVSEAQTKDDISLSLFSFSFDWELSPGLSCSPRPFRSAQDPSHRVPKSLFTSCLRLCVVLPPTQRGMKEVRNEFDRKRKVTIFSDIFCVCACVRGFLTRFHDLLH